LQVIRNFLEKHHIGEEAIALGVSGGADSLALALMFKEELPNRRLVALTVDHGLRPSSTKEALYVGKVMQQFGIEHYILRWEGEKPVSGIEEQARIARYKLLCDWCKENNIRYLAIAHHLYDQAETFLMRLQRGSGLYGLAAMNEISLKDNIFILRPFLNIVPQELKNFLQRRHINWVEDESNQCRDFLRVRMRQFLPILAKETGITPERLALAAENLQLSKTFIDDMIDKLIAEKVRFFEVYGCSFDCAAFDCWHDELKFHLLRKLIANIGEGAYFLQKENLFLLIAAMKQEGFSCFTIGGVHIQKYDFKFFIIKEVRSSETQTHFSLEDWKEFVRVHPEVRGIKLPYKLKVLLTNKKIS